MAIHSHNELDFKSDLYARIPGDGELDTLLCENTLGDMPISIWQYIASSMATDNFTNGVVQPTLQTGAGRWLKRTIIPTDTNQLTNGAAFITGISSGMVTAALTYTPANPNGTSGQYMCGDGSKVTIPTPPSTTRTTSTLSLSLVGTGATGTQISATKDSTVRCTVSTSTTSTIGGPATSVVALKMAATNDSVEGNWATIGTFESDQTITLAIVLNSLQIIKGQLCADIPAGYYVKLVNSGTGTHAEQFISGQKTIYG